MSDRPTTPEPEGGQTPTPPVAAGSGAQRNLDVILDLDLPLTVRFGQTQMSLGSLLRLGPGSVIGLERTPEDPVEVLVNDTVIARGEVVAVSGNYAVRITDIMSPAERIAELGG